MNDRSAMLKLAEEVDARQRTEKELHAAWLHARSLIETNLDPLLSIDLKGKIIDVNQAAEEISGVTRDRSIGTDISIYVTEPEKARAGIRQVLEKGFVRDYPLVIRHTSGKLVDVECNGAVSRDEDGRVTGVLVVARDVTERKRAEKVIALQADRHAMVLATSRDGFWVCDSEGKLLEVNDAYCRMSGYSRDELLTLHVPDLEAIEKPDDVAGHMRKVMETGFDRFETQHRKKDGSAFDVEISVSYWQPTNQFLLFARDITERRHAEEEIRALIGQLEERVTECSGQLQAANGELDAFCYSVAHDLRSPLRAIDGFSQIVVDEHAAQLPEEARRYLGLVRGGAQQMARLIEDLLAFSRLGRRALQKQTISPAEAARQALGELSADQQGREIQIAFGDLPLCPADPALLKQVFVNLISNALKFTRDRHPARIRIASERQNGRIVYYVKDNGVGFDMRYAVKLFHLFQRLHRAEDYKGTGIGLAIVKRIVERHGGRVWAEAKEDQGATFYFTLGEEESD